MNKISIFLYQLSTRLIYILGFFLFIAIGLSNIFIRSNISLDKKEITTFTRNGWHFFLFSLLVLLFLTLLLKIIKKFNGNILFCALAILYMIIGIYIIINLDSQIRDDALFVHTAAINFNNRDFSLLRKENYIGIYPYQLGLVSYERILGLFTESPKILFLCNLIWGITINYFIWKISKIIYAKNRTVQNMVIIISYFFVAQFFFSFFAYGTIPGLLCLVISIYNMLIYLKNNRYRNLVLNFLFIILSCLLRNNYIIALIAMCIVYLLTFLKFKEIKLFFISLMLIISFGVSSKAMNLYYEYSSGIEIHKGMPKNLFLVMGLQSDRNSTRMSGWYNSYTWKTFREAGNDSVKAEKKGDSDLKKLVSNFKREPKEIFYLFKNKVISTWNEPTYQSVWSGPLESYQQYTQTNELNNLYNGGILYKLLVNWMNIMSVSIFLMSALSSILMIKNKTNKEETAVVLFTIIYFLGGFIFHLFWETKSQYVYPYVFLLIPLTMEALNFMSNKNKKWGDYL